MGAATSSTTSASTPNSGGGGSVNIVLTDDVFKRWGHWQKQQQFQNERISMMDINNAATADISCPTTTSIDAGIKTTFLKIRQN